LTTTNKPTAETDNSHTPVDPEELRVAMRGWPSGVTIVAACDGVDRHGMTVSSFTSVSLEPPQILICAERATRTHHLIEASGAFAVSVLGQGHGEWSDRFGGRETEHTNRFEDVPTITAVTGSPIIADYVAYFDCVVAGAHEGGTHTIFVGKVVAARLADGRAPLLYWRQGYHLLTDGP
jgi:flavin reductase (DIM6/NTAB) family NADH-FMN oxidoreductase RutF